MNKRILLSTTLASFATLPAVKAKTDNTPTVEEKRNVLIFRASDSLLRFSKNSESYRFGGGFQRRLRAKHTTTFSKSVGTFVEFQSNKYGDNKHDRILRAYVGLQVDYINQDSKLDGSFVGIYPAVGVHQSQSGSHKVNTTVGGVLVEAGKSFNVTSNLTYRPNIGYRKFAGRSGELLIRPLEFAITF